MRRRSSADKKPEAGLEICPVCGRDFVQPVSWEPAGEAGNPSASDIVAPGEAAGAEPQPPPGS